MDPYAKIYNICGSKFGSRMQMHLENQILEFVLILIKLLIKLKLNKNI